jgi:hypothetical protein
MNGTVYGLGGGPAAPGVADPPSVGCWPSVA